MVVLDIRNSTILDIRNRSYDELRKYSATQPVVISSMGDKEFVTQARWNEDTFEIGMTLRP
jgi:hypothetical protein